MASVVETSKLVDSIVRLRRAERVAEVADEIAPVRHDLESRVGPTLTRSRASRLLGVSQTALDRWVDAGGVPIVITPRGRREVPLRFVVELREEIERLKREGVTRHGLARALGERRDAAKAIDVALPAGLEPRVPHDHGTAERRNLAYHRAVAIRLDAQVVAEARARVDRLAGEGHLHPRYADRWREILALPLDAVAEQITQDSQEGRDLRQSSPFAGVLNEQERRRIIESVR